MTGHTAHTGHTRALDTERESQVTHGDLDHGVRVHIVDQSYKNIEIVDKFMLCYAKNKTLCPMHIWCRPIICNESMKAENL